MTVQKFSHSVTEKLGFYVYALKDPANRGDRAIFYVGKGTGNRVFSHAEASERDVTGVPNAKFDRIREIRGRHERVQIEILRHGLTEREAFEIEAVLIEQLRLKELLVNLVEGHGKERGRMSAQDVVALYGAKRAPKFPKSLNAVLLRIPVLWYPAMAPDELYGATRGWWRIGRRRENADYAFAVNRGVIREVYKVSGWRAAREHETEPENVGKRFGFDGSVAEADPVRGRFLNTDVARVFKRGAANPVRFVNC